MVGIEDINGSESLIDKGVVKEVLNIRRIIIELISLWRCKLSNYNNKESIFKLLIYD